jgi:hypothetical protein
MGILLFVNQKRLITPCGICAEEVCGQGTICEECQRAFEPDAGDEAANETSPLNLGKYAPRMFPWEQMASQPRLIVVNPLWLVLALGLVTLVLVLALLRTPLPSCWELSS